MDIVISYSKWIVPVVLLIIIALVLRRVLDNGPPLKAENLDRSIRKEIGSRVKSEDFLGAGDVAYSARAYHDAADFYARGKDFIRAADAFAKAGRRNEAILYYKRAGQPQRAADLLEKIGQHRQAAQIHAQNGNVEKAASLYMEAKDFRKAATLFEELGQWVEAGEAYERTGSPGEAAQAYTKFLEQELQMVRGKTRKLTKQTREKALFVARHHEQNRKFDSAARVYQQIGQGLEAARLLTQSGKFEGAAQLYIDARKPGEAAQLFERIGDNQKASFYRGEAHLINGEKVAAAREFALAGEMIRAADLYSESGESLSAAQMYEKAQDFRSAAEQYNSAQDINNAARCYEEGGDYRRAAELYNQLGNLSGVARSLGTINDYFLLGKILLEHDRKKEALAVLQRVERNDPNFREACEIQGDLLQDMGQPELALEKYKLGTYKVEPNTDNLSAFYKIGLSLEATGDLINAQKMFERILSVDYYFKEAKTKAERLKSSLARAAQQANARHNISALQMGTGLNRMSGNMQALARPNGGGNLRYEVIDEIARGGMGIVYKARDVVLNRTVAYKILSDNLKNNPTAVKYFLREARAAAALSHPNIVTVYDAGEQDGEYYMAMELVQGETLKSLISRSGPFHEKLVRFVLVHACRGLGYAHEQNIVHRDIKSGNMMLTKDKTLKIMDFGLAKFLEEYQSQHTKAIGTPFYMSPEQILGHDLDYRSDLYSLGVMLFECSTGTVPFYKGELSYHHIHTQPPNPRSLNPNISPAMERIILKLLQKKPDDRFQSAAAVLKALRAR